MVLTPLPLPQEAATSIQPKLYRLDTSNSLYRIHSRQFEPIFFGRKEAAFRFDDPLRRYGVLYGGLVFLAAVVETLLHDCEGRRPEFSRAMMNARSVSQLSNARVLRLVDLRGEGAMQLGLDARIWSASYDVSQEWSRWLYEHKAGFDGLIYPSRHSHRYECVALFDRCRRALRHEGRYSLSSAPYNAIITRYSRENRFDIIEDADDQFV